LEQPLLFAFLLAPGQFYLFQRRIFLMFFYSGTRSNLTVRNNEKARAVVFAG
jgi:hypothetical protein